jgi:hypothetical protein
MDWTEVLAEDAENRRARLAAEILASSSYQSTGEKARAFVQQDGGCRATFLLGGGEGRERGDKRESAWMIPP